MSETDERLQELARRYQEALSKRPIEEQIAVGLISKNVLNGCSWEFVRPSNEVIKNMEAFNKSSVCSVQEVTYNHEKGIYGHLIYMKMEHLCKLLSVENQGPVAVDDLKMAARHRQEAQAALIKRIKAGYKGLIGIFCTNDSQTITVDGQTFPAYAITLKELCVICKECGYGIVIKDKVRLPEDVLAREDAIIKASTVAPSSNALFISIAPLR